MRFEKKIVAFFDNFLWYFIYLLPLIVYVFKIGDSDFSSFNTFLSSFISTDNFVFTTLNLLFGSGSSILEVFTINGILLYLSYFINCVIIHVIVDFILVVPRVCHCLLDKVLK